MYTLQQLCGSMSSKRYLLILIVFSLHLCFAETYIWQELNLSHTKTDQTDASVLKLDTGAEIALANNAWITLANRLDVYEKPIDNAKQELANQLRISAYKKWQQLYGKACYEIDSYNEAASQILSYNPNLPAVVQYTKNTKHHVGALFGYDSELWEASLSAWGHRLYADPEVLDAPDGYLANEYLEDLSATATVEFKPIIGLTVHASQQLKEHRQDDYFDTKQSSFGIKLDRAILPVLNVSASSDWLYNDSDTYPRERRNQLVNSIRLSHHFHPQVAGFVSFVNRSTFARIDEDIYLLANYLRSHLLYSLPYDQRSLSFLLAGIKIRPENLDSFHPDTGALFAETNLKLGYGFYLGGNCNLQKAFYDNYGSRLSYWFSPYSDIFVEYKYQSSNSLAYPDQDSFVAGTAIRW